jgi:hypothetical protein
VASIPHLYEQFLSVLEAYTSGSLDVAAVITPVILIIMMYLITLITLDPR